MKCIISDVLLSNFTKHSILDLSTSFSSSQPQKLVRVAASTILTYSIRFLNAPPEAMNSW